MEAEEIPSEFDPNSELAPPEPTPRRGFKQWVVHLWRVVAAWFVRLWIDVRPGAAAKRGAMWGVWIATLVAVVVGGQYLETGFGIWADYIFALVVAGLLMGICALLVPLLLTILRALPRLSTAIIVGSLLTYSLAFGIPPISSFVGVIACIAAALVGGMIASLRSAEFQTSALRGKIIAFVLLVLAVGAAAGTAYFLSTDGTLEGVVKAEAKSVMPAALQAANPGEPGPYKVRMLTYGTKGGNLRRPEYNNPGVATPTVDASRFFKDFKGWKSWIRKKYWGYGMDKLPLNATVWLPEGAGPFPVVLIVHGNHGMADFSDPGYRYLGELLASRGFILATIDENFLNSGLFHDPPKQQAVRGWMLLEHLKLWRDWSKDANNPLDVAIDFSKIGLMGHSRGGEAVATAALFNTLEYYPDDAKIRFDYHFPIQSLVAIAPVDGQYKPAEAPRVIEDVNYFTIHGANDADVSSFMGSMQFDRVKYPTGGDWFKSELYIYRANHGQFNTSWGRSDAGYPLGWFLNLKPLLPPEDQRRIAKVYLTAFLEATLKGKREYLPLFRDYRTAKQWLPETPYINRFEDAAYRKIADFSEDADITTTTLPGGRLEGVDLSVWREGRIPRRSGDRGYNGVFLGWNHKGEDDKDDPKINPSYAITLPGSLALTAQSKLVLSVAALDKDAPLLREKKDGDSSKGKDKDKKKERDASDFTLELATSDGVTVSRPVTDFAAILPPLKSVFTKLGPFEDVGYENPAEAVFQTITIPLAAFGADKKFDATKLRTIRLRFDRTAASVILVSKVGVE